MARAATQQQQAGATGGFPCTVLRPGYRYRVPTMSLMKALEIEQIPIYLDDAQQGGDVHRTVRLTGHTMYPSSRLAMMLMMCAIPSVSGNSPRIPSAPARGSTACRSQGYCEPVLPFVAIQASGLDRAEHARVARDRRGAPATSAWRQPCGLRLGTPARKQEHGSQCRTHVSQTMREPHVLLSRRYNMKTPRILRFPENHERSQR